MFRNKKPLVFFTMLFFQAEDGIRDRSPSRGLGDVYKRQEAKLLVLSDFLNEAQNQNPRDKKAK